MIWSKLLYVFYIILIAGLLSLIALGANSQLVFWTFYLAIVLVLSLIVLTGAKYRLVALVLFDIFIFLIFTIQFPAFYQVDRDTGFESLYADELARAGRWDPSLGTGYAQEYYGYNPLVHFVLAFLTLTTNLSTHLISKFFLIVIFRVVFVLAVFRVIQQFLRQKYADVGYYAVLFFLITPQLRILYISRRFMAALMILLALLCLLNARRSEKKTLWNSLFLLFSLLVIVADHTMSILFGAFLLGSLLFYAVLYLIPAKVFPDLATGQALAANLFRLVVYLVLWLAYNLFVSPIILMGDLGYLTSLLGFFQSVTFQAQGTAVTTYSLSQQWLIYLSQGLFVLIATATLLLYLIRAHRSLDREDLLLYFSIFSFPLFLLMLYLIKTEWVVLANVTLWFFLIAPSIFLGLFLYAIKQTRSIFFLISALCLIELVFAGGILLHYHPNVLFNDAQQPLIELPEYKNPDIIKSAEWLASYTGGKALIVADRSVFDVYSAYFGFVVSPVDITKSLFTANQTELEKTFLMREVYFGTYRHTAQRQKPDFVVFNKDLLSHPSYHFELTEESLKKFEQTALLRRIYENNRIIIYENLG